jgi:hypothetical protein
MTFIIQLGKNRGLLSLISVCLNPYMQYAYYESIDLRPKSSYVFVYHFTQAQSLV